MINSSVLYQREAFASLFFYSRNFKYKLEWGLDIFEAYATIGVENRNSSFKIKYGNPRRRQIGRKYFCAQLAFGEDLFLPFRTDWLP